MPGHPGLKIDRPQAAPEEVVPVPVTAPVPIPDVLVVIQSSPSFPHARQRTAMSPVETTRYPRTSPQLTQWTVSFSSSIFDHSISSLLGQLPPPLGVALLASAAPAVDASVAFKFAVFFLHSSYCKTIHQNSPCSARWPFVSGSPQASEIPPAKTWGPVESR